MNRGRYSDTYPLVTLAFPLYRSACFLEIIKSNIEAIDYPNVEILVSDRHCHDDTLERLKDHFPDDRRLTFIAAHDELEWVSHYNFLLQQGTGKYFRWMPHDDNFSSCDLRTMVAYLEANPRSVLVWGPTTTISREGDFIDTQGDPAPRANPDWTLDISLLFNFDNYCSGAFKGLFRRDLVSIHNLHILRTYKLQYSERCWVCALSLLGDFHFTRDYHYEKRMYSSSTHAQWQTSIANIFSQCRVMLRYLFRLPNTTRNRLVGTVVITALSCRKASIAIADLLRNSQSQQQILNLPPSLKSRLPGWIRAAASKPSKIAARAATDSLEKT